jgi:Zn-dependent M28 family amino/carboxypeptidase
MKKLGALAVAAVCLLVPTPPLSAQAPAPAAAASAPASSPLIAEVLGARSRLDEDLRVLTDEVGGRITGSAGYEKSLRWGQDAFRRAGVDSVKLEAYDAPARWEPESASAALLEPAQFPVGVVSFGLSPSTPGALTAPLVDAGEGRAADFQRLGPKAKGAIALVRSRPMLTFADLFAEYLAGPEMVQAAAGSGAAAILYVSTRPRTLHYRHMNNWDGTIAPLPMAQIGREDGQRLLRLLEKHGTGKLTLDVRNRSGGPWRPHNVVAEIRGSEKPDEIVLLGAHLDAWDLGTGALDNGVNCALVVEVARAIAAGPRPKRTIRFVLFTGEETGLLGSRGYVASHRGELDRHVAAVIHDIGDGRTRGYFDNGRPELAPAVRRILAPVASWGADGTNDEALLGTDNFDFLLEGVPNFVADQETDKYLPEYHAESDTFDKVDLREARINAAIAAVMVSGLANAAAPVGARQSREEIAAVLQKSGIDSQMKTYGLWADWENGRRGRSARPAR